MERALSVAVVQGGASMEAEVSRASARGVAEALVQAGHAAVRLELDGRLSESLRTGGYDVVFPVAHGAVGEDGALQGLLEVLNIPYVGSGVLASALAMNKAVARRVLAAAGLPVAAGMEAPRPHGDDEERLAAHAVDAVSRARREVGMALVIKPSSQGSALGVARFDESAPAEQLAEALVAAWELDNVALLEHFAVGREITCGVLDAPPGPTPLALPPTEITSPRDPFYTYEARYAKGRSLHTCPADIGAALIRVVQTMAVAAHRALGCRDLSRLDLVLGDRRGDRPNTETVTLLEVNTLPGFTPTSLYPEAAARAGIELPPLCDALVRAAHARGPTRRLAARPLPT